MEKIFVPSQIDLPIDRVFIVAATLSTFKGCRHLDVQIFRPGATDAEVEAIKGLGLVAPVDPSVPAEVLQAADESTLSFGADYVLPKPMDPRLLPRVARAVAIAAVESGVARIALPENYML